MENSPFKDTEGNKCIVASSPTKLKYGKKGHKSKESTKSSPSKKITKNVLPKTPSTGKVSKQSFKTAFYDTFAKN